MSILKFKLYQNKQINSKKKEEEEEEEEEKRRIREKNLPKKPLSAFFLYKYDRKEAQKKEIQNLIINN